MIDELQPTLFQNLNRQPPMPDDICAKRHKGNSASVAANNVVNKRLDRDEVLSIIRRLGTSHSKQIARVMNRPLNAISGRISELKALELIEETEERREGCCVLRIKV